MKDRQAEYSRKTGETDTGISVSLDGGESAISTGVAMLDHMLDAFSFHGRIGIRLTCSGDRQTGTHHVTEDCALALGEALHRALDTRKSIARFGWAIVPMDDALARVAVDFSGRPYAAVHLGLKRFRIGDLSAESAVHFFHSLAVRARVALHVDMLKGENDHHKLEAAFKALGLAFRQAVSIDGSGYVPSTKEVL